MGNDIKLHSKHNKHENDSKKWKSVSKTHQATSIATVRNGMWSVFLFFIYKEYYEISTDENKYIETITEALLQENTTTCM